MTVTKAVYEYLDSLKECDISGWKLYEIMELRTGRKTYPSTLLKICRNYADITGADFDCIDNQKSKYHFIPGVRLGSAIIAGRE